ncbi:hypothetical protein BABINDRAFT_162494 [Babjeviella inositovora NRRL Y-12698]|uniref:RNA exonuclease 3 n=1 Tax=Babjeviella inositovora NRRL Y-12698 TaxID=984486 RepID=A0A1E3QMA2_9ASCO|nr:uncharacterized protein BABINDRAFT_162494 [Babjeviella inositovora NRRL Y-12698]ODQ78811.1 hypothetical protein BABINDRAFT_162494 [Babjeviella inositovora NRRL Y-12698]
MATFLDIICPTVNSGGTCVFPGCIFRHDSRAATAEDLANYKRRKVEGLESRDAQPQAPFESVRIAKDVLYQTLPLEIPIFQDETFEFHRRKMIRKMSNLFQQRQFDYDPIQIEADLALKVFYNSYNHCMNKYLDTLVKGGNKRYVYDLDMEYSRVQRQLKAEIATERNYYQSTQVDAAGKDPGSSTEVEEKSGVLALEEHAIGKETEEAIPKEIEEDASRGIEEDALRGIEEATPEKTEEATPEKTEEYTTKKTVDALPIETHPTLTEPISLPKISLPVKDIPLAPIPVHPNAPAVTSQRVLFILEILKVVRAQYPRYRTPTRLACQKEYAIASTTSNITYSNTIKKYIFRLKKGQESLMDSKPKAQEPPSGMVERLQKVVIPVPTLQLYGFVTEIPEPLAADKSLSFKHCVRCNSKFNVQNQLVPTTCQFHPKKLHSQKVERMAADNLAKTYECCGNGLDSIGCVAAQNHVYKPEDPRELHHLIPFIRVDSFPAARAKTSSFKALGVDCEMGYTSWGFEAIRVTFVDYLTGKTVYDTLVKPQGEVIDLNSQFSGVSHIPPGTDSFEEVFRNKMFEYMDQNTILIGHGLENDVNVMRIIHDKIVDTSVLYPRNLTARRSRRSLKQLAFQYLSRVIQTGEHDSSEDALAAIDIVKFHLEKK